MRSTMSRATRALAVTAAAMLVLGGARAAEEDETVPVPPEPAAESSGEQQAEPAEQDNAGETKTRRTRDVEVNTRREHGQTITEYSRNGEVFLMIVKPRVGPKQYWQDPDGDGQFQRSTSDDIDESVNLPKWRIGTW